MKILMVLFGNIENDGRVLRSIDTLKDKFEITSYSHCDKKNFEIIYDEEIIKTYFSGSEKFVFLSIVGKKINKN